MKTTRVLLTVLLLLVVSCLSKCDYGDQEYPAFSCQDLKNRNSSKPSGIYWIQRRNSPTPFAVYCDQDFDGGGWTLIESFTRDQSLVLNNAFTIDRPENEASANWEAYRLSKTSMLSLCESPANCEWRATCGYRADLSIVEFHRDYIRGVMAKINILSFEGKECHDVSEVNIVGDAYTNVEVNFDTKCFANESGTFGCHLNIDAHTICEADNAVFPAALDQNFFGYYDAANSNTQFRCSSNPNSITSWWIKETVSCSHQCLSRGYCFVDEVCVCEDGYLGDFCQEHTCFGIEASNTTVCSGNGVCEDLDRCVCEDGWYGQNCSEPTCFGVEHSAPSACSGNGLCVSLDECACESGYVGTYCNITICYGTNATEAGVCSGKGKCTEPDVCSCEFGYSGDFCSIPSCYGIEATNGTVCSSNGVCESYNRCNCSDGYEGYDCADYFCNNLHYTKPEICSGNGTCVGPNNCSCLIDYYGPDCEMWNCFGIPKTGVSIVCSGHGSCFAPDNCTCNAGFEGDSCEFLVIVEQSASPMTTPGVSLNYFSTDASLQISIEDSMQNSLPTESTTLPSVSAAEVTISESTAEVTIVSESTSEDSAAEVTTISESTAEVTMGLESTAEETMPFPSIEESQVVVSSHKFVSSAQDSSASFSTSHQASSSPAGQVSSLLRSSPAISSSHPLASSSIHMMSSASGPVLCFGKSALEACNGRGECVAPDTCICGSDFGGSECEISASIVSNTDPSGAFNRKKILRAELQLAPISAYELATLQWVLQEDDIQVGNLTALTVDSVTNGRFLSLKPDALHSGSAYRLSVLVTLGTDSTLRKTIVFYASTTPSPGVLTVEPSNGTALTTVFEFSTSLWESTTPLKYSFGYTIGQIDYIVSAFSNDATANTTLPAGNISVFVIGRSEDGDEARISLDIVVADISGSVADVLNEKTSSLAKLNGTEFYASVATITASITVYANRINKTEATRLIDNVVSILFTKSVVTTAYELKNQVNTIAALTSRTSLVSASTAALSANLLISSLSVAYSDDDQDSTSTLTTAIQVTVNLAVPLFSSSTPASEKKVLRALLRQVSSFARSKLTDNKKQELSLNNLEQVLYRAPKTLAQLQINVQAPKTVEPSRSLRATDGVDVSLTTDTVYSNPNMTSSASLISQVTATSTPTDSDANNRVSAIISVELYNDRQELLLFNGDSPVLASTILADESTNSSTVYTCRYFDSELNQWINDTSICWKSSENGLYVTCSCSDTVTHSVTLDYVQAITDVEPDESRPRRSSLKPGAIAGIVIAIVSVAVILIGGTLLIAAVSYKIISDRKERQRMFPSNAQLFNTALDNI